MLFILWKGLHITLFGFASSKAFLFTSEWKILCSRTGHYNLGILEFYCWGWIYQVLRSNGSPYDGYYEKRRSRRISHDASQSHGKKSKQTNYANYILIFIFIFIFFALKECIGCVGVSVGKEVFLRFASEFLSYVISIQQTITGPEDPIVLYLNTTWLNICLTIKKDFTQYLPLVMPNLLVTASKVPEIVVADGNHFI